MKINVLTVGPGGRENALAWKISQSPLLDKLYLAGANDGFKNLGEVTDYADYDELARIAKAKNIELAVIGPELPLSQGIVDVFAKYGIKCIGATQKWAKLESSKAFAKEFMQKHNIPTAKYELVSDVSQIDDALARFSVPPVLKADGLAAGKGVYLPTDFADARDMLKDFLGGKYGEASKSVVVEEFLEGDELSVISIFNGKTIQTFIPARDYKRLKDNNEGPNTGGMGSYCPVKISEFHRNKLEEYLVRLERALLDEQADFCGIIYSGLMLTKDDVKVLEYNMRFGDPETQSLMMHLKSDLLEIFINAANGKTAGIEWNEGTSMCVVLASEGYPENPRKGSVIRNIEAAEKEYGVKVFYSGVKCSGENLVSNGGRVLCVCKSGHNVKEDIYKACEKIDFCGKIFRTDIGEKNERIADYCGLKK
ncbi:MAG: phosphoribosylamine--glycine ligase [Heliobacteriaceae bacterium]|jgi:phosphoribosylamine--glycine ligase|nr:phosphoribosylamine--glycine ligase [Heliobacteriaceae bacterium]